MRHLSGLAFGAAMLAGICQSAAAETRTVAGEKLVLTDTLSSRVVIDTDPSLTGNVRLSADGSLNCLSITGGPVAVIGTAGCDDDGPDSLRITVSPNTAVMLTGTGDGGVSVADLHAMLEARISDDFDIKAGHLSSLVLSTHGSGNVVAGDVDGPANLDTTGSGNVRIGKLRGPLHAERRGSGDLTVGAVEAPGVVIDSAGSGDIVVGGGAISALQARVVGSGDLTVAARVSTADVSASGGGDIRLSTVTGPLKRWASGGSQCTVGGHAVEADAMTKLSRSESGGDSTVSLHGSRWAVHLIMLAVVGVMAFFIWRVVARGRRAERTAAGASMHPGVQAVCETMTRLDQRLGRLESYVTTREFDLARKFRELGPG